MALEEYRRKRDFKKTPEPDPELAKARNTNLSYLVQKHDATRLHYDLRLELNGVLLSWAVTKGPSLDPKDKRLAVRTEDHPLSYGTFEGTIPKGQYGGGTVMLWDEGTWEPKADPRIGLEKGHLSFLLHGDRLKGGWDLIRMRGDGKRDNWLLIKEKDAEARINGANDEFLEELSLSVKSGLSMDEIAEDSPSELKQLMEQYPEVQLATLVDRPPEGDAWLHEIKFDGYRLLAFLAVGKVRLRTRNGKDWTEKFPQIVKALEQLRVRNAVLDMEAVVLDAEGRSSFQALQGALGQGGDSERIFAFLFDILHLDGKDLTKLPLAERKQKLQAILQSKDQQVLRYSEHVVGSGAEMLLSACGMGLEGIVSKQSQGPYLVGRQRGWLKTKCSRRQEFIILGYSRAKSGERALGALYLGYEKDGVLQYAGKVGTGFTMKSAAGLADRFAGIAAKKAPLSRSATAGMTSGEWQSIHWVKPVLLCEVAFTEWTNDGRIRHPSFQGLREDKDAGEVKKESPMSSVKVSAAGSAKRGAKSLTVGGVAITHPDRVISESGQITKGGLAEYYAAVSSLMLPEVGNRPLSLLRCPEGIDKQCFFQRSPGTGLGAHVRPFAFTRKGKKYQYLYIEDERGLLELIQMGAVEIHSWGARIDAIDFPDRLVFDLDPAPDVPFEAMKLAAEDIRRRLQRLKLKSNLKCTGGNGLHVWVQLPAKERWAEVKELAASVAQEMASDVPEAYVATMSKTKRAGKIFVDYFRNDYTATAIAGYSVRARSGAPVAVPLEWDELEGLKSANQFTIGDVMKRLRVSK